MRIENLKRQIIFLKSTIDCEFIKTDNFSNFLIIFYQLRK